MTPSQEARKAFHKPLLLWGAAAAAATTIALVSGQTFEKLPVEKPECVAVPLGGMGAGGVSMPTYPRKGLHTPRC